MLIGHYVAYRKLVSRAPSELLKEDRRRLDAVATRLPHNRARQLLGQERQAEGYDYQGGMDVVHVLVAGELPRHAQEGSTCSAR